ncbi:MAG TPA: ethanolamine ammonia-lyase reactivating factor EutA [Chloroflexota bacterium]|nr:ethanolamine ammonia-lyase reactivating factor EutA [Chloroflexota bacterium]
MHDDDDFPEHLHLAPGELLPGEVAEDVDGIESFSLTSVGIDIGSSTSHLVFSHLTLRRKGADLSTQFEVTNRQVLYRSPILLTPYSSPTLMDVERLRDFFDESYRQAGFGTSDIDTGAVVITGEALNKENAQPISELFARHSGKFICASAGPNHEALLAAHGCGAVALSKSQGATVLNIDMGGGTTKLSLVRDGVVNSTAALSVGARLLAFDEHSRTTRVEQPARRIMRELGHEVELGGTVPQREQRKLVELMVGCLFELLDGPPKSALARDLMVTEQGLAGYGGLSTVDYLIFSGGVSEYIYQHDDTAYGDLGPLVGAEVRKRLRGTPPKLAQPAEGIRATVIGAGEYTVQASGVTSYLSDLDVLPVFGLKVIKAPVHHELPLAQALTTALAKFDLTEFAPGLAIALSLQEAPNYPLVRATAQEIGNILQRSSDPSMPVYLMLDADVAKSLGGILKEELGFPGAIIAVDGIDVGDLDYVDIGRPLGMSESLPVTVKSLMFPVSAA